MTTETQFLIVIWGTAIGSLLLLILALCGLVIAGTYLRDRLRARRARRAVNGAGL